jgi:hypothetical protein
MSGLAKVANAIEAPDDGRFGGIAPPQQPAGREGHIGLLTEPWRLTGVTVHAKERYAEVAAGVLVANGFSWPGGRAAGRI